MFDLEAAAGQDAADAAATRMRMMAALSSAHRWDLMSRHTWNVDQLVDDRPKKGHHKTCAGKDACFAGSSCDLLLIASEDHCEGCAAFVQKPLETMLAETCLLQSPVVILP